jgi:type II secretory pathway pseudopilin PulG
MKPKRSPSATRGFSLVEALFTLALVGSVFGIIADLLNGALHVVNQQGTRTAAEQAAQLALQRLTCEARETVTDGVSIVDSKTVVFTKIDPTVTRFQAPAPSGTFPDNAEMKVTYTLQTDGSLTRTVKDYAGTSATQTVAHGLTGFSVAVNSTTKNLDLGISVQQDTQVRVINFTVWLPTTP